ARRPAVRPPARATRQPLSLVTTSIGRFVVYGAGGIGGVLGARLFEHDHDVVLIARGVHGDTMQRHGLRVESPGGTVTVKVPAVRHPSEVEWRDGDVVLLTMKSQDTEAALVDLAPL